MIEYLLSLFEFYCGLASDNVTGVLRISLLDNIFAVRSDLRSSTECRITVFCMFSLRHVFLTKTSSMPYYVKSKSSVNIAVLTSSPDSQQRKHN
jgi:hypothetical protein